MRLPCPAKCLQERPTPVRPDSSGVLPRAYGVSPATRGGSLLSSAAGRARHGAPWKAPIPSRGGCPGSGPRPSRPFHGGVHDHARLRLGHCGDAHSRDWRRPPPATIRHRTSSNAIGPSAVSHGLTRVRADLHRSDMERLQHRFNTRTRRRWRRVAEPGSSNPLPRRDVGNGLFPTHLRSLPTLCSGSRCMKSLTKQFEAALRSVLRCRCVPGRAGSPSQEGSEEGNRR